VWKVVTALALVTAISAALVLLAYMRRAPALTNRDTIILADFSNSTGDPVFDGTLRQGLAVQLEQSPFLSLISDERIRETLRLMDKPADAKLTPEIARDLCQRVGSKAYIEGSMASLGSDYVIGLKAVNCATGDSVAEEQVQADKKERVLDALGKGATKLRERLGESLSTVKKLDTPLEQATTPSLEALRAYSLALKLPDAEAIPLLRRAIALDPNFAVAYSSLGWSLHGLGEGEPGNVYIRKAFELRGHASDRERLMISNDYYAGVTRQVEKAVEIARLWSETYPRDALAYRALGADYMWLGQYREALPNIQRAGAIDPTQAENGNLEDTYLALNRFDDAMAALSQTRKRLVRYGYFASYELAFLRGDVARMANELGAAEGSAQDFEQMELTQADTEMYYGRAKASRTFASKAVSSAAKDGRMVSAGLSLIQQALRDSTVGLYAEATSEATSALALNREERIRALAALALAWAGHSNAAKPLIQGVSSEYPPDSILRTYWTASANAAIALDRGNPRRAIDVLTITSPVELSGWTALPNATTMYPVYLRGQAYLGLGEGKQAAAEFRKILDHRGLILNCPLGALAHLQLGRAYAMSADTAKARAAYQDFLSLWKDADPDIPILVAAKAEYAKL
jgi:tetratricopeptide (TPR) repeat protein